MFSPPKDALIYEKERKGKEHMGPYRMPRGGGLLITHQVVQLSWHRFWLSVSATAQVDRCVVQIEKWN